MKSKLFRWWTVVLVLLIAAGCRPRTSVNMTEPQVLIRLSHSHPADFNSELHLSAWLFKQWVEAHSTSLKVQIYPAGTLGQERDVYEGMQLGGGVSCVISGTAILNTFCPEVGLLDLPFLWRDYDHVHCALDGVVGQQIAEQLKKRGFIVLAWMDSWGYRNIVTAKKSVHQPSDLKGLKIRTIESPVYIQAMQLMGVNPTPMAFGEVYSSLQTGVLDGFEHSASVVRSNRFYETAKHIVLTRHLFGPLVFCYSQKEWEKLTDSQREVVQQAALFARDIQRALAPVREKEAFRDLKIKGMSITTIDTYGFEQKAHLLQDEFARQRGLTDLLEQIRRCVFSEEK